MAAQGDLAEGKELGLRRRRTAVSRSATPAIQAQGFRSRGPVQLKVISQLPSHSGRIRINPSPSADTARARHGADISHHGGQTRRRHAGAGDGRLHGDPAEYGQAGRHGAGHIGEKQSGHGQRGEREGSTCSSFERILQSQNDQRQQGQRRHTNQAPMSLATSGISRAEGENRE